MNYFAFISYTGVDRKWASWLHKRLESYKIPTGLGGDNEQLPKSLRPVFWYKKDLSGTVLSKALCQELDDSRFLVVVCSPEASRSEWVNDEVSRFIETGRADKIIPFVVNGEPHAARAEDECLPPALRALPREMELRAICVADQGKRHALVDVIATMLGLRFDALWQRYRRQRQKMMRLWAALIALLTVCGAAVWDYTRERTEYYNTFVDEYGIPQGVERLTSQQVAHREVSLRFTYRRTPFGEPGFYQWRLRRIEAVNSAGVVSDTKMDAIYQYPMLVFDYANGHVDKITGKDSYGRTAMIYSVHDDFSGGAAGILDLTGVETTQTAGYMAQAFSENGITTNTKIKRLHLKRDSHGRVVEQTYHSNNDDDLPGSAIANEHEVFGERYQRDANGRIIRTDYMGYDGQPIANRFGVSTEVYNYTPYGHTYSSLKYFDPDGRPIVGKENYHAEVIKYDVWGNHTEQRFFDCDGSPCYSDANYSICLFEFDSRGNQVKSQYLGADSTAVICSYGWSSCIDKYDRLGRNTEKYFYDEQGAPAAVNDGFAIAKLEYDGSNRIKRWEVFDKDGQPTYHKEGFHRAVFEYDAAGYQVKYTTYDVSGRRCFSSKNFSEYRLEYDKYHRVVKVEYFDTEGRPCLSDQYYHKMCLTYDARGNRIKEEFFDTEGNLTLNQQGYAIYELGYDNSGNLSSRRSYGPDGEPIYINSYVLEKDTFTPKGLLQKREFFDASGGRVLSAEWVAIEVDEYNAGGKLTRQSFLGADSLPTLHKDLKYSSLRQEYDRNGNVKSVEYFDVDGKPAFDAKHISKIEMTYDNRRKRLTEEYFGPDGEPVTSTNHYHKVEYKYDSRGNLAEMRYFDVNGRPTADEYDVATYRFSHNARGEVTREEYLDKYGRPAVSSNENCGCELLCLEYDHRGNISTARRCRADGTLMRPELTSTALSPREEYEYDEKGNRVRIVCYDTDGSKSRISGYCVAESAYDNLGRRLSTTFYDADGHTIGGPNFFARFSTEYITPDSTATAYYDNNLRHIVTMTEVKANGRVKRIIYTDSIGGLMMYVNPTFYYRPFAMMVRTYDLRGNNIRTDYYGADGRLLSGDAGHASDIMAYDDRGRLVEAITVDAEGGRRRTVDTNVSRVINKYNDFGFITEQTWLDEYDKPSENPWGFWKVQQDYDNFGRRTKALFWLPDGTVTDIRPQAGAPRGAEAADDVKKNFPKEMLFLVLCSVEGQGQMWDEGYRGLYVVLEFETWKVGENSLNEFGELIQNTRGKRKHLVLWRFDENDPEGGEVFDQTFSEAPLTARLMDQACPDDQLVRLAMARLAKHKAGR